MPSFRNQVASFGLTALSTVGLALVVHGWVHPEHHTDASGLSLLIIGALGTAVRTINRATMRPWAERRECMTTYWEEQASQNRRELDELRKQRAEVEAIEAQLVERVEAKRTEIYAEATGEMLRQLSAGLPLIADGAVVRTLPARRTDRPEGLARPSGCTEGRRREMRKDYLPN